MWLFFLDPFQNLVCIMDVKLHGQFLAAPRQKMTVPQCEETERGNWSTNEVEGDQTIVSVAYTSCLKH